MSCSLTEKIAVMQAALRGKVIQFLPHSSTTWRDAGDPLWDWDNNSYRVKPELREFWVRGDMIGDFSPFPREGYVHYQEVRT